MDPSLHVSKNHALMYRNRRICGDASSATSICSLRMNMLATCWMNTTRAWVVLLQEFVVEQKPSHAFEPIAKDIVLSFVAAHGLLIRYWRVLFVHTHFDLTSELRDVQIICSVELDKILKSPADSNGDVIYVDGHIT